MATFVGRSTEINRLRDHLRTVSRTGDGVFLSVRGRRQVGKSRLVEEFLRTADAPSVYFTAARGSSAEAEIRQFSTEVTQSTLEAKTTFGGTSFDSWDPMLRLLASSITAPSIVVIDELPYLIAGDRTLEGVLQRVWDRHLSRVPILLIVVGSDLSMMESLSRYDRPLYQRMSEMIIEPLTPAETGDMLRLGAVDALEAQLVHGGFPTLAGAWGDSTSLSAFLTAQLETSTSPLVVVGERILNAEFPPGLQARSVLESIGTGHRNFAAIGNTTAINQGSLTRTLHTLVTDKRVVAIERPLASRPTRNALYRVADPYLRFWLCFLGPQMELILRGRGDVVVEHITERWSKYRGRAIEPLVRASIEQLLPEDRFGDTRFVGSYWTRSGDVEVDLVGGAKGESPSPVTFIGSVKWRNRGAFDRRDIADLAAQRPRVPGAESARLVGVSRSGFDTDDLDVALTPADLLAGWAKADPAQPG